MADLYTRTWVYSSQQQDEQIGIHGKGYQLGTVLVNGVYKPYTEILRDPTKSRFSDAKKLITGDLRRVHYTKPTTLSSIT